MMNLLYTNQENKEEKKATQSQQIPTLPAVPLIGILTKTNLELGKSTSTYITTTTIKKSY